MPNKVQVLDKDFFYNKIIDETNSNLVNYGALNPSQPNRAVLIFFENEEKLEEFRESKNIGKNFNHMTLTEKIED